MTTAVLDTLRCAQTLKDAGFTPKQAEATAQVLGDALADVATKEDLDRQTAMQKADFERLEAKIDDTGSTGRSDLERHAAMQNADLERHAAMQKADLDNAVAGLNTKIAGLDAKIAGLDAKVAGLGAKIDGLNAKVDNVASAGKSDLKAAVDGLDSKIDALDQKFEAKFDAMDQRFDSMETSTQNQLVGIREEIKVLADVFKHHIRTTYIVLASFGTLATLATIAAVALGALAYLPPQNETPALPAVAESPGAAPEIHSAPAGANQH